MSTLSVQVVVVDDDSSVRWIIEQTLAMVGITYASAATGMEGIRLIDRHSPPLAIVDAKLGAMSGLDVVRSIERPSKTKALMVTGCASSIQDQVSDLPVLGVLEKPFDIQHFLKVVQEALRTPA